MSEATRSTEWCREIEEIKEKIHTMGKNDGALAQIHLFLAAIANNGATSTGASNIPLTKNGEGIGR